MPAFGKGDSIYKGKAEIWWSKEWSAISKYGGGVHPEGIMTVFHTQCDVFTRALNRLKRKYQVVVDLGSGDARKASRFMRRLAAESGIAVRVEIEQGRIIVRKG